MKGCLKFIFSIIFTGIMGIALIIFFAFGGVDYVKNIVNSQINPPEVKVQENAQKIGNFTKVPKGYKLTRVVDMVGIKAVVAEEKKTTQKMALVNPGWIFNITKNDIRSNAIDTQLEKIASKFNTKNIKLSTLEVVKKGNFKAFNQNIPYARIKVELIGNKARNLEGIIGVAQNPADGQNTIVVSMNEPGKYNQQTAEKFFKSIKFSQNNTN